MVTQICIRLDTDLKILYLSVKITVPKHFSIQAMAAAIRDTQVDNPNADITKVIVHEETAVANSK